MIVDAHHHLWRIDDGYRWLDEPELAPIRRSFLPADPQSELSAARVDRMVLVEGGRCGTAEAAILLRYGSRMAAIGGVVAWADPAAPALADTIARYQQLPGGELLVRIRPQLQGEADPEYLDLPQVRRGLRTIAEAGLAFDVVVRADQLAAAARDVLELGFVLGHLRKPRIRRRGRPGRLVGSGSGARGTAERHRQALRAGHRGRLEPVDGRGPAPVRRRGGWSCSDPSG